MKNLIKIGLSVVLCSCLLQAKDVDKDEISMLDDPEKYALLKVEEKQKEWDEAKSGFSVDIGTWYMMWDQTSDASDKFGDDALEVKYDIEDSAATVAILNANYKLISGKLEYYSNEATAKNDEVSSFSLGFFAVGLIPNIDFQVNYISSKFKGGIEATRVSDNATSTGTFETDLNIWDLIIYPYNDYVGLGYRNYNYEVPQDMYVVNNNTDAIVISGLADIEYDGSFIELVVDNKKQVDKEKNYNGIVYSISGGIGQLDAVSKGYEQYLTKADAIFIDAILGYSYKSKDKDGFGFGLSGGYRYNSIKTEANVQGEYSMITEFTTEFHGPFVNLVITY